MTLHGSWIWYELMTPDADGSKAFYERVVGWTIQTTRTTLLPACPQCGDTAYRKTG